MDFAHYSIQNWYINSLTLELIVLKRIITQSPYVFLIHTWIMVSTTIFICCYQGASFKEKYEEILDIHYISWWNVQCNCSLVLSQPNLARDRHTDWRRGSSPLCKNLCWYGCLPEYFTCFSNYLIYLFNWLNEANLCVHKYKLVIQFIYKHKRDWT